VRVPRTLVRRALNSPRRLNPAFDVYRVTDLWPMPCTSLRALCRGACSDAPRRERARLPAADARVRILQPH
jgi:hypothetical protein